MPMQVKRLAKNIRLCVTLSIAAGLLLAFVDAADVLLYKGHFFDSMAQAALFLIFFLGVSVIFSSFAGLIEGFIVFFLENKPVLLASSVLTLVWLIFLYAGLEYGTFFHKPKIVAILAAAALLAYPLNRLLLREIYSIKEGGRPKTRLLKVTGYIILFLFLYWINSRLFFNQNFFLHLIMALAIFFLVQFILFSVSPEKITRIDLAATTRGRLMVLFMACAAFFSLFNFDLSQNVKRLSFDQTSIERFMLYTLKRVIDLDGDKYTFVFGGGDRDDFNKKISPQAGEIPGNGIDENGFCGDYKGAKIPPSVKTGARGMAEGHNVVILIIDALRPDHMGCYGYHRKTTPFMDKLSQNAYIFKHAYAQACHTRTSMPSFMLSQYQPFAGKKWKHQGKTMAELFKENGYHTISVIFYKLGDVFVRGYDDFYFPDSPPSEWNSEDPFIPAALERIDKARSDKFFLWMHLPYPHHPYTRHPGITDFGDSNLDRYDNEISYTDKLVGDFYEELNKRGLADKTIFVILADHGEEFGEHGGEYHNSTSYNEQIHVPLLILMPRRTGSAISENVQLIDLNATLLHLSGIEKPDYYQGKNFAALFEGETDAWDNLAVSGPIGSFQRFAAIEGNWKLIFNMRNNTYELYELGGDPREQRNLIDKDEFRDPARKLTGYLHEVIERNNLAEPAGIK